MDEFIVTKKERYTVSAYTLEDAQYVWERNQIHGEFADDVERLDEISIFEDAETKNGDTYQNAIKTLIDTADFYYSMYGAEIDSEDTYWFEKWRTALDLLERVQGLQEGILYEQHLEKCGVCKDVN